MNPVRTTAGPLMVLIAALTGFPVRAADFVKCLPDDAKRVICFSIRQYLDSPLAEKDNINLFLDADKQTAKFLKDIDLDPVKDIDRIIFASSNREGHGVVVILGKFDSAKILAGAKNVAQKKERILKIHKTDFGALYEIPDFDKLMDWPNGDAPKADSPGASLFLAVVDDKTVVVSNSKETVHDALARVAGKKEVRLKDDELAALVAAMDPKQTLTVAIPGSTLKHIKVKSITGGFTVEQEVKIDLKITAEDAKMAKKINRKITGGMFAAKFLIGSDAIGPLAESEAKGPLLEIARVLKHKVKGADVMIKGTIKSETLLKLLSTWPE